MLNQTDKDARSWRRFKDYAVRVTEHSRDRGHSAWVRVNLEHLSEFEKDNPKRFLSAWFKYCKIPTVMGDVCQK